MDNNVKNGGVEVMGKIHEINGKNFEELTKFAEEGDCILIVNALPIGTQSYSENEVFTVEYVYGGDCYVKEEIGEHGWIDSHEYIVVKEYQ